MGFDSKPGHGDHVLGQCTLHRCVPFHPGVQIATDTTLEVDLQLAGILFREVEIL